MITFKNFGKLGNLGNHLHQLASLIGFSEKYNCELVLPEWRYEEHFKDLPKQASIETDVLIEEPYYHYTPEFWDAYSETFRTKNVAISGWLQSEKYWQHCKEKVFNALTFKEEIVTKIKKKYSRVLVKDTIAISIRRGDFVTNPNHYLLPIDFYLNALLKYFPGYIASNIIIFSDDFQYCKTEIRSLPNVYFASGLTAIEQLCLMSLCNHFIISNSTFSWWGAMLGEKESTKVIRSPYYLEGPLKDQLDIKDYYPERWISYDHIEDKMDLGPVRNSHLSSAVKRSKYRYKARVKEVIHKFIKGKG